MWQTAGGRVTKDNLAYITHLVCRVDNGRVLGYDNSHGGHHRHFMGKVEPVAFTGYACTYEKCFRDEVRELWALGRTREEEATG